MRLKCILELESKDFVENVKHWARPQTRFALSSFVLLGVKNMIFSS